ncbi:MAG: arsenical resistance protein ArsH [Amylibacter sp.]
MKTDMPNIELAHLEPIDCSKLGAKRTPPKFLLLYGSLRTLSYSRSAAEEAARVLTAFGAECVMFDSTGLPQPDSVDESHPKVMELRDAAVACDGMVWSSPERHGSMTGIMKTQIDWLPLSMGGVRPTQGKTLAVIQVSGGSQSFNTLNQLRVLGRWMRMIAIPNQSSIPKAWQEFDSNGRLRAGPYYNRLVDVMEELMKFTLLTRDRSDYLVNRYSERVETAENLSKRVNTPD